MASFNQLTLTITLLILTLGSTVQAQEKTKDHTLFGMKQSIGAQLNPMINFDDLLNENRERYVFAIRYGLTHKSGFSFGPEFSGNWGKNSIYKSRGFNYGLFLRYAIFHTKKVSPFIEASSFYAHYNHTKTSNDEYHSEYPDVIKDSEISYYLAIGASISLVKNKLSLDLMLKYNDEYIYYKQPIMPSFRVQFHF